MVGSARIRPWLLHLACLCLTAALFQSSLAAGESEQEIRDRIENQFKIKAFVAKPGDALKLIKEMFDHLGKIKAGSLEARVVLENIMLVGAQDEATLDRARTGAGFWINVHKLPPVDCYEYYLGLLKALRDKGRSDKDTLGIELFFTRNDEVKYCVQVSDYTRAVKIATDNRNFADTLNDRDIKNFAYDVLNNLQRREKLQKRKDEMLAALSPDPDAPAANAAVAAFLLLEAATRSEAMPYLLKAADPLMTPYAELRQARAASTEFGCRDLLRLGELAYQLSKKAVSDEAREDLLNESNEAFDAALKHPDAEKLVDANNIALSLALQRGFISKVSTDLLALKRKSTARADDLVYLFTHTSFFAPPMKPLGSDWSYPENDKNEWSLNGSAFTLIKGGEHLTCNTKLQEDFVLSFDMLPMTELQDKTSTVFYGIYFNNGMRAGIQNNAKENGLHFLFDFGKQNVTPLMLGFNGWTRWEIRQKAGVVNVFVNGKQVLSNTAKSANAIAGTFSFSSEPPTPLKLRNIRVRTEN